MLGKREVRDVALATATGFLGGLSFSHPSWHFLIWITFVPLLLSLRGKGLGAGFFLGLMSGTIGFLGACYWIWGSTVRFLVLSPAAAILLFLLFLGWHGLQLALFTVLLQCLPSRLSRVLSPPLLWVVLERFYPTLFPWQLGNALQPHLPFIQLAEVTGGAGLSFAVMLVNSLLARAYEQRQQRRTWLLLLLAPLTIVISLDAYGRWRIGQVERREKGDRALTVALVQGNLPAVREADAAFIQQSLRIYSQLSLSVARMNPDLILWPEAAVRTYLPADHAVGEALFALAEQARTILLVGTIGRTEHGEEFNSAFLISPYGDFLGSYHKTRLLPFVEYLPRPFRVLQGWWSAARLVPGREAGPLLLPGTRMAPSICYEVTVPGFFREAISQGAEFLVSLTNDAWLGNTSGPLQHLQAAVMRAVESRRWLVRAANSGVSAIIAPSGRIVARTELFAQATLQGEIILRRGETLYIRWGDWFGYICLGGILFRLWRSP